MAVNEGLNNLLASMEGEEDNGFEEAKPVKGIEIKETKVDNEPEEIEVKSLGKDSHLMADLHSTPKSILKAFKHEIRGSIAKKLAEEMGQDFDDAALYDALGPEMAEILGMRGNTGE